MTHTHIHIPIPRRVSHFTLILYHHGVPRHYTSLFFYYLTEYNILLILRPTTHTEIPNTWIEISSRFITSSLSSVKVKHTSYYIFYIIIHVKSHSV